MLGSSICKLNLLDMLILLYIIYHIYIMLISIFFFQMILVIFCWISKKYIRDHLHHMVGSSYVSDDHLFLIYDYYM